MFFEGDELTILLKQEDIYIDSLKQRWNLTLSPKAEHDLRMGKRTELLGDLESSKIKAGIAKPEAYHELLSPLAKSRVEYAAQRFQQLLDDNYELGRFSVGISCSNQFILYEHFYGDNRLMCTDIGCDKFGEPRAPTIQSITMFLGVPVKYVFVGKVVSA